MINLQGTYRFEHFNADITNPILTIINVGDNIKNKICGVDIILEVTNSKFGIILSGFEYKTTWEDSDIYNWVEVEIEKYKISEK
jgi:hypothetical protein